MPRSLILPAHAPLISATLQAMAHPVAEREATFQRGLEAYREGLYYEAHELWEEIWEDEDDDDHRRFLQALIQVTSALHKFLNDVEPRGSLRLIDRALLKLEGLPDMYGGVALGAFRDGAARCRTEIDRLLAQGMHTLDPGLIPPLSRIGDPLPWKMRPLPPVPDPTLALQRGMSAYQQGLFFEAHEIWEELWRNQPDGLERTFLQGLILVAAAMHKLLRMKSASGAVRLLARAHDKLVKVPDGTWNIGVQTLRTDVLRAQVEIERLAQAGRTDLPPEWVPRMGPARGA
jgi:uncharacterized protein